MSIIFESFGEGALLLSWPNKISEKTSKAIYCLNLQIQSIVPEYLIETVTAYCSLTLYTQPNCNKEWLTSHLKKMIQHLNPEVIESKIWDIPVCYDLSLGIDLENLAKNKKLAVDQVIQLHSGPLYTVEFLGFLPGFPYLRGLNPLLHTPRLSTPRSQVESGSVAIGNTQTGIYPIGSPGGWHIIGKTPLRFFDPRKTPPCFIRPFDRIKFCPIGLDEYHND